MSKLPKISVIVPIYNIEKYVGDCIQSIIEQTYKKLEIVLINDGSTDSSGEICRKYEKLDKRIKLINADRKVNGGGLSQSRNLGIDNSTGDFLFFVDGDDYIKKETVEELYNNLRTYDADISCCTYNRVFDGKYEYYGDDEKNMYVFNSEQALKFMLSGNGIASAWGKIYKRGIFDELRYKPVVYEDLEITPKVLKNAKIICYSMKPLYQWRFVDDSISNKKLTSDWSSRLVAYKMAKQFIECNYSSCIEDIDKCYVLMSLDYLYRTLYIKNNFDERNMLAKEICSVYRNRKLSLCKKDRIKMNVLCIDLRLFDLCHIIKNKLK